MLKPDQRYPRACRLVRGADFDRVYRRRATASDGVLLVFADRNGLPHSRLGLSVSRKVGGAVVRNRWKRRLREAFRLNQSNLPPGIDLIVIPRAADGPSRTGDPSRAGELSFDVLAKSLVRLAARAERKLT